MAIVDTQDRHFVFGQCVYGSHEVRGVETAAVLIVFSLLIVFGINPSAIVYSVPSGR
jgi:hypothetical protein